MKYKCIFFLIIALTLVVSCTKDGEDLSVTSEIGGISFVEDTAQDDADSIHGFSTSEPVAESDAVSSNDISEHNIYGDDILSDDTSLMFAEVSEDAVINEAVKDNVGGESSTVILGSSTYTYNHELEGYVVSASGLDNQLVIFPEINGLPVVAIADNAFAGMCDLKGRPELPSTLKYIGERAFDGCYGLEGDLFIPDSVTEIGISAFENCYGLDGILYIGKGLKEIKDRVFYNCNSLSGDLMIPGNISSIGSNAFFNCISPENQILFSNTMISIEADAFLGGWFK